jgi:RNA polymerase sigma-70 factor (ECF subfamily)
MNPTFDEIYDSYADQIYRICRGYLYDQQQVDDLFQDVMANIWQGLEQFRGESKVSTWIYRIAVNTAITYNRRAKRTPEQSDLTDRIHWTEQPTQESATNYDLPTYQALHRCIHQLPNQERLIMTLVLEDLPYKEIASVVGISVNYVGVKINRIKTKLGDCIPQMKQQPEESDYE